MAPVGTRTGWAQGNLKGNQAGSVVKKDPGGAAGSRCFWRYRSNNTGKGGESRRLQRGKGKKGNPEVRMEKTYGV